MKPRKSIAADGGSLSADKARGLSLREIQDRFQAAILTGDRAALADIMDNSRTGREVLFGVYANAYVGRLIEIIGNDHEQLHRYLGDEGFDQMARAYIAAHPSRTQNARWVSRHIPQFLGVTEPWRNFPEIVDVARIEQALNTAFDAPDGPVIGLPELTAIPPERWDGLMFSAHPSAHRFNIATNGLEIWRAMKDEADPPEPQHFGEPVKLLVWRQGGTPKIRVLLPEEAMMWDEAGKGMRFGVLCEMVATFDRADEAAMRAARYLAGWLGAGLLSATAEAAPRNRR